MSVKLTVPQRRQPASNVQLSTLAMQRLNDKILNLTTHETFTVTT